MTGKTPTRFRVISELPVIRPWRSLGDLSRLCDVSIQSCEVSLTTLMHEFIVGQFDLLFPSCSNLQTSYADGVEQFILHRTMNKLAQ